MITNPQNRNTETATTPAVLCCDDPQKKAVRAKTDWGKKDVITTPIRKVLAFSPHLSEILVFNHQDPKRLRDEWERHATPQIKFFSQAPMVLKEKITADNTTYTQ